jgi:hypothetical protein
VGNSAKQTSGPVGSRCAAAEPVRLLIPRWLFRQSYSAAFADQPLLDEIGGLRIVLVHHQHVGITLDAHIRQIDDVDAAAGALRTPA